MRHVITKMVLPIPKSHLSARTMPSSNQIKIDTVSSRFFWQQKVSLRLTLQPISHRSTLLVNKQFTEAEGGHPIPILLSIAQ